jgi:hypothetical protein
MIESLGNINAKTLRRENKNTGEKPVPEPHINWPVNDLRLPG